MIIAQLLPVSKYFLTDCFSFNKERLLTKVTSKNSSSSLRSENVEVMVLWKSFHRRQNCSVDISPVDIAQPAIWNKYQMSAEIHWNFRLQQTCKDAGSVQDSGCSEGTGVDLFSDHDSSFNTALKWDGCFASDNSR